MAFLSFCFLTDHRRRKTIVCATVWSGASLVVLCCETAQSLRRFHGMGCVVTRFASETRRRFLVLLRQRLMGLGIGFVIGRMSGIMLRQFQMVLSLLPTLPAW
jgi:hypothetical protein